MTALLRSRLRISAFCGSVRSLNTRLVGRRFASKHASDAAKIRNMALVAHIDSGKTTLTESILLKSSYLSSSGSVDTGSTTTDFLPAERERGITIQSASIPVKWRNWTFNLIDTPGHADFGMEVESASRVVDGAVVLIDSVEGVEAQTKGVWRQLDRYGVPTRLMFLNKLDRPGASYRSSLLSLLSHRLHRNPMALTLPIASFDPNDYNHAEPGIQGLVDLVKWECWKWDKEGLPSRHPLPRDVNQLECTDVLPSSHPIISHLVSARTALLEGLSMHSEDLLESLLNLPAGPSAYLSLETHDIMPHLRAATLRNDILPILCGSAMKNIGTELVMDYIGELLASPLDVQVADRTTDGSVRMLAWKVAWDKKKGWMTFVRVYSGTLRRHASLHNVNRNQRERAHKLLLLYASEAQDVEEIPFGSVGVVLGLKYTRTGDTLVSSQGAAFTDQESPSSLPEITPPPSVISASIIPQSHSDTKLVNDALQALSRTDPSVRFGTHEGQILVHGLGALHLEIVEGRLRDEWDARFEFGKQYVSYREGLGSTEPQDVSDQWTTDIGGKPAAITVAFTVGPLKEGEEGDPVWDGNVVVGRAGQPLASPETFLVQNQVMGNVARGILSVISNSPHTSLPMSHVSIQVNKVFCPPSLPSSMLTGASATILRNHIRAADMGPIMEPFVRLKVTVNEDSIGRVVKDLTEHGGEVLDLASSSGTSGGVEEEVGGYPEDGIYVPPGWLSPSAVSSTTNPSIPRLRRSIHAVAPLSQMLDYSSRLRALSGGHGLFEMTNEGFRVVSADRKLEILKEIGRA